MSWPPPMMTIRFTTDEHDSQLPGQAFISRCLWTTNYGKGRVFVTTLGHGPDEVVNQGFVVTFSRGAEWAATGKVTLPLPAEMRK